MKKITIALSLIIPISISLFNSCTYKSKEELLSKVTCDSTNVTYNAAIQQLVTQHCNSQSGCHGANAGSISLLTYQNVYDHVDNVLDEIVTGGMPKSAPKLDDCTIGKFQNWVNNGSPQN